MYKYKTTNYLLTGVYEQPSQSLWIIHIYKINISYFILLNNHTQQKGTRFLYTSDKSVKGKIPDLN